MNEYLNYVDEYPIGEKPEEYVDQVENDRIEPGWEIKIMLVKVDVRKQTKNGRIACRVSNRPSAHISWLDPLLAKKMGNTVWTYPVYFYQKIETADLARIMGHSVTSDLKMTYAAQAASPPAIMHSEMGSRRIVCGHIAALSLVHLETF